MRRLMICLFVVAAVESEAAAAVPIVGVSVAASRSPGRTRSPRRPIPRRSRSHQQNPRPPSPPIPSPETPGLRRMRQIRSHRNPTPDARRDQTRGNKANRAASCRASQSLPRRWSSASDGTSGRIPRRRLSPAGAAPIAAPGPPASSDVRRERIRYRVVVPATTVPDRRHRPE